MSDSVFKRLPRPGVPMQRHTSARTLIFSIADTLAAFMSVAMSGIGVLAAPVIVRRGVLRPTFNGVVRCASLIVGLLAAVSAYAGTPVGGIIAADTTWTLAQSPYTVNADVTVKSGAVLTIEAGTVVYMNAGINLIVNEGSLRAKGSASAQIVITSSSDIQIGSPAPGNWGQIVFQDNTNDANTIVEWARIRYGSGLRIESASPTLNNVTIENHAGAAISMDLKSSPVGAGLSATGNTINGISVPAGEIVGAVSWQLKGIPYVVTQGEVSVGSKPVITGVTPAAIQQGFTVDAVISGTRLAGVESVSFDAPGVTATLSAGASDSAIPLRISVSDTQALGNVPFEAQTAAGKVRYDTGLAIISPKPTIVITSIVPSALRRGESKSIQITGTSLQGAQISPPSGAGLTLSNLVTTDTQANFTLAASASATLGAQALTLTNAAIANSATATVSVNPALPVVFTNPAQLSAPPNNTARPFTVVLANSDTVAHTLNLSIADATIATIAPASVTIPAGSTQATINITGLKLGFTLLNITSPTLASVSVQVYVTNLLNGAVIGPVVAPLVGVLRGGGSTVGPIVSPAVGVFRGGASTVGPIISVSPPVGVLRGGGSTVGPIVSPPVGVSNQ